MVSARFLRSKAAPHREYHHSNPLLKNLSQVLMTNLSVERSNFLKGKRTFEKEYLAERGRRKRRRRRRLSGKEVGSVRTAGLKSKEFGQRVGTDFGRMVLGYRSIRSNIWSAGFRSRARPLFQRSAGHEATIDFHRPPCALDGLTVFVYFGNLPPRGLHTAFRPCTFATKDTMTIVSDERSPQTHFRPKEAGILFPKADFLLRLIGEERSTLNLEIFHQFSSIS